MRWLLTLVLLSTTLLAAPQYPDRGPDIYDPKADGGRLVEKALIEAKHTDKRVLLDFGANWCPWCHKLHTLFKTDPRVSEALLKNYVVVMLDVNMRKGPPRNAELNAKYGNPIKEGLPVLVVLDADGKQLITQETGALEEGDHHDPQKVLAFLNKWAPAR